MLDSTEALPLSTGPRTPRTLADSEIIPKETPLKGVPVSDFRNPNHQVCYPTHPPFALGFWLGGEGCVCVCLTDSTV